GEGKLHDLLVGFASADDAVVRPNRSAHPLPLLDDVRVGFLDELAHSAEGFPAPVPQFGDSFRDELRCRLALAHSRLFHVLITRTNLARGSGAPPRGRRWGIAPGRRHNRGSAPRGPLPAAPGSARGPARTARRNRRRTGSGWFP